MLLHDSASTKHYLNQPVGDLRTSPKLKLAVKTTSKKSSKPKVTYHVHQRSEPNSGGISARSSQAAAALQPSGYNQKTFYSAYIGANS